MLFPANSEAVGLSRAQTSQTSAHREADRLDVAAAG